MIRLLPVVSLLAIAGVLWILSVHDLCAQDAVQGDHSCTADVAFLGSIPEAGDERNFVSHGWGLRTGVGAVWPEKGPQYGHAPQWSVTGDYLFTKVNAAAAAVTAAVNTEPQLTGATAARATYSAATLEIGPRIRLNTRLNLYGAIGFGWLRREIGFTGANPNTLLASSDPTLGRLSSNSGVFDAAVGANYSPKRFHGLGVFAEARVYHGLAINTSTTLVPISAGIRW